MNTGLNEDMKVIILCLIAFLSASSALRAMEKIVSDGGNYVFTLGSDLAQSKIGHYLSLELVVEDENGQRLTGANIIVKGGMPGHGHGLPTSPKISEIKDGVYLIKGLKFTMPGLWQLVLVIENEDITDFVVLEFKL